MVSFTSSDTREIFAFTWSFQVKLICGIALGIVSNACCLLIYVYYYYYYYYLIMIFEIEVI